MSDHLPPAPEGYEPIAYRSTRLGASELGAALGYDRYTSPHTLWAKKRGLLPRDIETVETEDASTLGRIIEEYARDWFQRVRRAEVAAINPNPPSLARPGCDELMASPDGQVILRDGGTAGLECKWRTVYDRGLWGAPGTDQVPLAERLQALGGLLCTGWSRWFVVVIFGTGTDRAIYEIHRDDELLSALETIATGWVRRYLRGDEIPPVDGADATTEYLKQRYPKVLGLAKLGTTPDLDAVATALAMARGGQKVWKKLEDHGRNVLRAVIGDAPGIEGGWWNATWTGPKDGPKPVTDWEAVARAVLYDLEMAKGGDAVDYFAAMVKAYTTTPDPERRLTFNFDLEHYTHVIQPALDRADGFADTDPRAVVARPYLQLDGRERDRPGELGPASPSEGSGGGALPDGEVAAEKPARRARRGPRRV